jgi:uncharacterized protein (PEP-CTERM system associated)
VQSSLESSSVSNNGTLVNSQTGAPVFVGNNLLGTETQIYSSRTLTIGGTTLRDRDTITVNLQYSDYTLVGAGASGGSTGITGTATWTHELTEDLTLNTSTSYGRRWSSPGGASLYIAATGSLTYHISQTLSSSLTYEFYDVNATGTGAQSMYQDLLILSLNKTF